MKIFFRINQQKGLTLVEVIIATVIFTLIATILVDTFSQGYQQLRRDRMRIIAYFLAQERMEELLTFAEVFPNPQLRNETRQQVNNFTQ
ncbi:MAG: type II secretion system GspH family protein, partial [Candidatus Omnitrophica bacterium]|nr:type II secretion system GspH family protein [Candidatus Omnitrophota bacterium]